MLCRLAFLLPVVAPAPGPASRATADASWPTPGMCRRCCGGEMCCSPRRLLYGSVAAFCAGALFFIATAAVPCCGTASSWREHQSADTLSSVAHPPCLSASPLLSPPPSRTLSCLSPWSTHCRDHSESPATVDAAVVCGLTPRTQRCQALRAGHTERWPGPHSS